MPMHYELHTTEGDNITWVIVGSGELMHMMEINHSNYPEPPKTFTVNIAVFRGWLEQRREELGGEKMFEVNGKNKKVLIWASPNIHEE
jgi:hypothetical protein